MARLKPQKNLVQRKLFILAICFLGVLWCLWLRAFYVQIIWSTDLSKLAEQQYWNKEEVHGLRGEIFDRNGRLLAKSVRSSSVFARPPEIKDPYRAAMILAKVLNTTQRKMLQLLRSDRKFVWISQGISDKQVNALKAQRIPGIFLARGSTRLYPQSHLAGQLLGFVGRDGEGLEGLERSFNTELQGESARNILPKDASGSLLYSERKDAEGMRGQNITLTIDSSVQFVAEDSLARRVQEVKGKYGFALVVDVRNGDILAWANYPFFNPNTYVYSRPVNWRNRIALDNFEPGSILKPFLIAAALQEGICSPNSLYFCENGSWEINGRIIRDDSHQYGWLSVDRILRFSSNIGCSKIGLDLDAKTYYNYLQKFGFTENCNMPLPGEGQGILASPRRWGKFGLATISFGQGIAVTALQMARGYLCLLNNGYLLPLRLIASPQKTVDIRQYPQVVSSEVAENVVLMMERTVVEDGTGTQARLSTVRVGGKTGTAQKASPFGGYGQDYLASFVGFFPSDSPRYLVLVAIDSPKNNYYGGAVAIPIFREIAEHLLAISSGQQPVVKKEISTGNIQGQIVKFPSVKKQDTVPNLNGVSVREAIECAVRNGVMPEIRGEGTVVVRHLPEKGEKWDETMILWLGNEEQ